MEPLRVVAELAEHTGGENHPKARLAGIDLSRRVPPKMLGHHLLELRDLLVQRGDQTDLADDDGRVGSLDRRRLTQPRRPQHRLHPVGLGLGVAPGRPQRCQDLAAGQLRRPGR